MKKFLPIAFLLMASMSCSGEKEGNKNDETKEIDTTVLDTSSGKTEPVTCTETESENYCFECLSITTYNSSSTYGGTKNYYHEESYLCVYEYKNEQDECVYTTNKDSYVDVYYAPAASDQYSKYPTRYSFSSSIGYLNYEKKLFFYPVSRMICVETIWSKYSYEYNPAVSDPGDIEKAYTLALTKGLFVGGSSTIDWCRVVHGPLRREYTSCPDSWHITCVRKEG